MAAANSLPNSNSLASVAYLNPQFRRWEHIYNTVRPQRALGYLTPLESIVRFKSQQKKAECH